MLYWLYDCLVHFVTGNSHAQRILLNLDLVNLLLSLFKELEPVSYKVHDPRTLTEFQLLCQEKLKPETLSELQNGSKEYEKLTDLFLTELEVDPKYRHLVLDAVVQMSKFYSDLKKFEETSSVVVSEDAKQHRKLFENVWKTLENRSVPKSYRVCKSDDKTTWGYLGFQMPLSDFRKTGLLGLLSLDSMVTKYPELSRKTLTVSRNDREWFPFSLTSINVTSWVLDFYNQNKLNAFSYNNKSTSLDTFYVLHSYFFFTFVDFYLKKKPESVLQFNEVANEYKTDLAKKLKKMLEENYDKDKPEQLYGDNLLNKLRDDLSSLKLTEDKKEEN